MSIFPSNDNYQIINPKPKHFKEIQELCQRVYPFTKPWSFAQLESHQAHFPDGQLIALEKKTGKVVGLAFSLIVSWDDYSPQDNWEDFTSAGFFHNHNPRGGRTLYGAEIMVDPNCRGQGIGKMLYLGRIEIARKYGVKRIRAGSRLRGYSKFAKDMSAEEYTRSVINKDIFDPTLSFQISAGFIVIGVARSYIYNDPESLGFAAVIEWLNPETATEKDIKKQSETVQAFISDESYVPHLLPRELRHLVRKVTIMLGEVIKELEGDKFYTKVEKYRLNLKKMRKRKNIEQLESLYKKISNESSQHQLKITHAFSILMELINVSETAYRTWRLQQKPTPRPLAKKTVLNFVLTSHPTEARSPLVLDLLKEMTDLMIWGLQSNFDLDEIALKSKLRFLWQIPLSKSKKPTVVDEAEFIFSHVLKQPVFDFILATKPSYDLKLRTWVGGDKDGHPGINENVMVDCLNVSRKKIILDIKAKLIGLENDLIRIEKPTQRLRFLINDINKISTVSDSDSMKISQYKRRLLSFFNNQKSYIQQHQNAILIRRIFENFPGLVLPIELREDSKVIANALNNSNLSISKILLRLQKISRGGDILDYACGLVISHCEETQDIINAQAIVKTYLKQTHLPIIPLFETREALINSVKILRTWISNFGGHKVVYEEWENKLEIMLGYSDSAKEMGVLGSRHLIQSSMFAMESLLKSLKIIPIFFHGSGGSVARGGGSLREQMTWWSDSAARFPKLTIQGEMIPRLFTTDEILNSQALHMSKEAQLRRSIKIKPIKNEIFNNFCHEVEQKYRDFVGDIDKLENLLSATPYDYLDLLKIGSRPSKRKKEFSLSSLRAIPWVLCWTQTRTLFPTWWGLGSSWKKLEAHQKESLIELFQNDSFFSSFIKTVGFTLAKVEPEIWHLYLKRALPKESEGLAKDFYTELKLTKKFVSEVSGERHLIWYRPWLEESIRLRSAYIHILNLLQIHAMSKKDEILLRETLVGIASGMLTTG